MNTQTNIDTSPNELERLYKQYFNQEKEADSESESLLQPSPLECVDSFTTSGITDDLLVHKEE